MPYMTHPRRRYKMFILDILFEITRCLTEKEKYVPNTKKALKYTAIIILVALILILILLIVAVLLFVR